MPDRLDELLRQRSLLQEHLAWLDREIALATGQPPRDSARPALADVPAGPETSVEISSSLPPDAERILAQHRLGVDTVKQSVRKGCFLYFAAALLALFLLLAVLYITIGRAD